MYKILYPESGCLVFATKWHTKLKEGARIGVCKEIYPGVIRVSDELKDFAIITGFGGHPFHDFWLDSDAPRYPLPRAVHEIVDSDFNGVTSAFARENEVKAEAAHQWVRGKWIIYGEYLYSPQLRHDRWSKKQQMDQPIALIADLINFNYSGSDKAFSDDVGHQLKIVQSWVRKGWIIFNGTVYSPIRPI